MIMIDIKKRKYIQPRVFFEDIEVDENDTLLTPGSRAYGDGTDPQPGTGDPDPGRTRGNQAKASEIWDDDNYTPW